MVTESEYTAIRDRVHKTVPQDSLVGMLMDAPADLDLRVVHSSERGVNQHSVFTWDIEGDNFVYVDGLTDGARFTDTVITQWLAGFSDEEAGVVVDALFQALEASGAQNATEVLSDGAKSIALLSEAVKNIDTDARDVLLAALGSLAEAAAREGTQGLLQHSKSDIKRTETGGAQSPPCFGSSKLIIITTPLWTFLFFGGFTDILSTMSKMRNQSFIDY